MKKSMLIFSIAAFVAVLLTGCGSSDTGMTDTEAVAIESAEDISGNWVAPGRDFSISFEEDESFTEKEKLTTTEGSYQFMSQNTSFTLGELFEEVEYITCVTEKEKAFFTGAVLGDLISGYNETQKMERYYVRQDRKEVAEEEILGYWEDANGDTYYCELQADGSLKTTDWEGSFEMGNSDEYGTTVTFHFKDYDEEYAVIRYEKYLFLYRVGTSNVYMLQPKTE